MAACISLSAALALARNARKNLEKFSIELIPFVSIPRACMAGRWGCHGDWGVGEQARSCSCCRLVVQLLNWANGIQIILIAVPHLPLPCSAAAEFLQSRMPHLLFAGLRDATLQADASGGNLRLTRNSTRRSARHSIADECTAPPPNIALSPPFLPRRIRMTSACCMTYHDIATNYFTAER